MFPSRYMPCPTCGDSVERADSERHRCNPDRRVEFQMFALRDEVASLESEVREFADTQRGRFEAWMAARCVRDARGV